MFKKSKISQILSHFLCISLKLLSLCSHRSSLISERSVVDPEIYSGGAKFYLSYHKISILSIPTLSFFYHIKVTCFLIITLRKISIICMQALEYPTVVVACNIYVQWRKTSTYFWEMLNVNYIYLSINLK